MAVGAAVTKYWVLVWGGIAFVITQIIAAIIQSSVEATAKDGAVGLSLWPWLARLSVWLSTHWFGLLGWTVVISLLVMIWLAYREEMRIRPVRVLEHYLTKAFMFELEALHHETNIEALKEMPRLIQIMRGDLLNMIPKVFNQASAPAFQGQSITHIGKAREQVIDLPDAEERAWALAHTRTLLGALMAKWQAYGGNKTPTP